MAEADKAPVPPPPPQPRGVADGVIAPIVGAKSPRRRTAEYSYYASKSELIEWVNRLLHLEVTKLEEFASGAVYCQILDAYFPNIVAWHKINFHAREEYEFIVNYKQLQAGFSSLGITREIDVQKLMRGSPSDGLEFLQWLYKYLKKKRAQQGYAPKLRRAQSAKGGTDQIPTPSWMSGTFDVYGRVEGTSSMKPEFSALFAGEPMTPPAQSPHRSTSNISRTKTSKSVKSRTSRTLTDETRSNTSEPPALDSLGRPVTSPTHSNPAAHDQNDPSIGSPRSHPLPAETPSSTRDNRTPSPMGYSVDIRSVTRTLADDHAASGQASGSPRFNVPSEVASGCVHAIEAATSILRHSIPNFRSLLMDLGASNDSYAYRGKVRSMRDVMNTLFRHSGLLLDDLSGLQMQQQVPPTTAPARIMESKETLKQLEGEFQALVAELAAAEKVHPVPRSSTICITDKQKELSDARDLDGALRRVGAAQAALAQALLKESIEGSKAILYSGQESSARSSTTGRENTADNNQQNHSQDLDPPSTTTHTESHSRTIRIGDYQIRRLKNGDIYKGRYVRSKKNGEGVYQFMNGDVYEGDFKDDRMGGYGLYTFSHEGRYEGQWCNASYEGVGTETFARGSTYHGEYSGGMRNGWGVCRYYNGDYYEGKWRHGLREGRGMQQCTDDSNYVGDYLAGKRHGFGVYSFPNGDRYLGEYERDIPHGCGVYMFASGQKYEGQWHSGKKHGWCIYTIETGDQWAGEWTEGKPKWVQGLTNGKNMDERWSEEICSKVSKAWTACEKAQQSAREGASRADEHWATDGPIQHAIRDVVHRADEAAAKAQAARKRAIEVAAKLDALAGEQENQRNAAS